MKNDNTLQNLIDSGHTPTSICIKEGPMIDRAVYLGDLDHVKSLLQSFVFDNNLWSIRGIKKPNGDILNVAARIRISPLNIATICGHQQIARLLLDYNADPTHCKGTEVYSPLEIATKNRDFDMLQTLINYSQHPIHSRTLTNVLYNVCGKNDKHIQLYLMNKIDEKEQLEHPDYLGLIQALEQRNFATAFKLTQRYQPCKTGLTDEFEKAIHYINSYLKVNCAQNHDIKTINTHQKWQLYLKAYISSQYNRLQNQQLFHSCWGCLFSYSANIKYSKALTLLNQCFSDQDKRFNESNLREFYTSNKASALNEGRLKRLFEHIYQEIIVDGQHKQHNLKTPQQG